MKYEPTTSLYWRSKYDLVIRDIEYKVIRNDEILPIYCHHSPHMARIFWIGTAYCIKCFAKRHHIFLRNKIMVEYSKKQQQKT